jgi:hypothetical protein
MLGFVCGKLTCGQKEARSGAGCAWGWIMKSRLRWLLAACAIIIAVGGILLLWALHHDVSASHLWQKHAATVLQYAIPPVIALFGWTAQQIITSKSTQSTPKQVRKARKALVGRGREWWRGIPSPAWPGRVLRAGLSPLEVTWAGTTDGQRIAGSTSNVKELAKRLRGTRPLRLVIRGPAGSGKSVFARLLMAELLKDANGGQPVPVFLPLWSWDPDRERMNAWIKRRISEDYPGLKDSSAYGPTAVTNLVDQGMVLPVLDGLDGLPRRLREKILDDGSLTPQDRLILTCRTTELDEIKSFVVITPEAVNHDNATRFLGAVTRSPKEEWDNLTEDPDIAAILSDPRLIYMASAICAKNRVSPKKFADSLATAKGATANERLLALLVPALMGDHGEQERKHPLYAEVTVEESLRLLAPLGLWERVDLRDPSQREPADQQYPGYPGMSCIAWWNLHRGVPWLSDRQAAWRAAAAGLITFLVTYGIFQLQRPYHYALTTAATYGFMIFFGCFYLGRDRAEAAWPGRPGPRAAGRDRLTVARRLGRTWSKQHPFVKAGVPIVVCAGILLWYRVGQWHRWPHTFWYWTGFKTGFFDGLNDALVVVLTFVIAGVPRPPRGIWRVSRGPAARSEARAFALAIGLGIPFGLAWGGSVVLKQQHLNAAPLGQALLTGLVTGLDFAMGAWLFRWSGTWNGAGQNPDPRSAARAEMVSALLRPLILGFTFAFAFGISAPFNFTTIDVWAWFVVGTILGSLGNEWPLYVTALVVLRRGREHKLPLRLMRFLESCSDPGLLRPIGQAYQIQDDGLLGQFVQPSAGQAQADRDSQAAGEGPRLADDARAGASSPAAMDVITGGPVAAPLPRVRSVLPPGGASAGMRYGRALPKPGKPATAAIPQMTDDRSAGGRAELEDTAGTGIDTTVPHSARIWNCRLAPHPT